MFSENTKNGVKEAGILKINIYNLYKRRIKHADISGAGAFLTHSF
jgi:hypothetical protein